MFKQKLNMLELIYIPLTMTTPSVMNTLDSIELMQRFKTKYRSWTNVNTARRYIHYWLSADDDEMRLYDFIYLYNDGASSLLIEATILKTALMLENYRAIYLTFLTQTYTEWSRSLTARMRKMIEGVDWRFIVDDMLTHYSRTELEYRLRDLSRLAYIGQVGSLAKAITKETSRSRVLMSMSDRFREAAKRSLDWF
jgi:hypothetical protein